MNQDTFSNPTLATGQAPHSAKPKGANRRWIWVTGTAFVFVAGAGGWFMSRPQANVPPPPQIAKTVTPVLELAHSDVGVIEARELQITLSVSGSLMPVAQAVVKARVGGELQSGLALEGTSVTRGQVIGRLSNPESSARLAAQQATLEEANARLAFAQKNNGANQLLLKQNYISQNAVDTSKNNVDLAEASVKSAKASAEIARLTVADNIIRSPISGIVSRRHAQPGEKVSPDSPVYTIVDLSSLNLEAQVPANEIGRIKINQPVAFQVDGFANRTFTGKVARINPTTEAGSRSIIVYISVENRQGELKGGMFAKGSITTSQSVQGPVVALTAVRQEKAGDVVYVIENNTVVAKPVQLGLRNEDEGLAEVTTGLSPGSRVIMTPLTDVRPGSKIKLPNVNSAADTADSIAAPSARKG